MWRFVLAAGILLCASAIVLKTRRSVDAVPIAINVPSSKGASPRRFQDNTPFEYKELQAQQRDMEALEPDPPAGATAQCVDLTYSFAKTKGDACKDHRGIYKWLSDIPPHYK